MGREPLCPRCGSSNYERLSDRESRCAECGLGRSHGTLMAVAAAPAQPPSPEMEARIRAQAEQRAAESERVFASAGFAPYALDEQWTGLRWVGGHGASNGNVDRLH